MLTSLLITLSSFMVIGAYLEYSVYREFDAPTEILNPQGCKTAIVIYHPGLTDFARNITYSFANGLVSSGWRVEIATASPKAPINLYNYSLLVLCWPIYDFNPGPTVTNQIQRIGNLNGTNTVIITIGGGLDPLNAPAAMNKIVQNANGTVLQSLTSFRSQRNQYMLYEEASKIIP